MQEARAAGLQGRFLYHDNEADELGWAVSVGEPMEPRTRCELFPSPPKVQCNEILTLLHISTSIFEGFYNSSQEKIPSFREKMAKKKSRGGSQPFVMSQIAPMPLPGD